MCILGLRKNNFKKLHERIKYYSFSDNVRHKRAGDALKNKNLALHKLISCKAKNGNYRSEKSDTLFRFTITMSCLKKDTTYVAQRQLELKPTQKAFREDTNV